MARDNMVRRMDEHDSRLDCYCDCNTCTYASHLAYAELTCLGNAVREFESSTNQGFELTLY